jgi:hypothetical protein
VAHENGFLTPLKGHSSAVGFALRFEGQQSDKAGSGTRALVPGVEASRLLSALRQESAVFGQARKAPPARAGLGTASQTPAPPPRDFSPAPPVIITEKSFSTVIISQITT